MSYGLSFMPGGDNGAGGQTKQASVEPVQEAVRLLSLRLPSVVNRGLAPNQLMQAPGGSALSGMGDMSVDATIEWLRKQMQQSQAQAPPQAAQMFQPPAPQVVRPNPGVFAPADLSQPTQRRSTSGQGSTTADGRPSGGSPQYPYRTETRPDGRQVGIVGPVPSQTAPTPQPNWDALARTLGRPSVVAGGVTGSNPLRERFSNKYEDEYSRG